MPTIHDPLPNGAPRNKHGLGGEIGHLARQARPDAIARLSGLLLDQSPLNAGASLEAAELALGGTDRTLKVAAVRRLHSLVKDDRAPAPVSVKAAGLLLSRCGKRSTKGGN